MYTYQAMAQYAEST